MVSQLPDADAFATDATDESPDVMIVNGCPVLSAPLGTPGEPAMGDTYAAFAMPLFTSFCVRCHSSTLVGSVARSGAPNGLDWNLESSVRMNLPLIRNAIGVLNYMPLNPPNITCDQRRHIVRWIDIGAP